VAHPVSSHPCIRLRYISITVSLPGDPRRRPTTPTAHTDQASSGPSARGAALQSDHVSDELAGQLGRADVEDYGLSDEKVADHLNPWSRRPGVRPGNRFSLRTCSRCPRLQVDGHRPWLAFVSLAQSSRPRHQRPQASGLDTAGIGIQHGRTVLFYM